MDWTTVAVTAVGLLLSGCGAVLWFLYLDVRKQARDAASAAAANSTEAYKKYDALSRELADHRQHVAEEYVTKGALTQSIEGLNRAIEALTSGIQEMNRSFSAKLDSLHQRLDSKADKP